MIAMRKQRGFTLIELLVVVAIIAMLMAILMPALQRVRKQARAVACQSNLRQWCLVWSMYLNDHNGSFHEGWWTGFSPQNTWPSLLAPYMKSDKIRYCPSAQKLRGEGGLDPYAAWGPQSAFELTSASYGLNGWACNPAMASGDVYPTRWEPVKWNWRTINAPSGLAPTIPLFLGCAAPDGKPKAYDKPPETTGDICLWGSGDSEMKRFCLARHEGAVGVTFFDFSLRKAGVKELWTLKWHRDYDTSGPWTRAGGVEPSDWPQWMRHYAEY